VRARAGNLKEELGALRASCQANFSTLSTELQGMVSDIMLRYIDRINKT
jgi:hypothetical protein